MNYILFRKLNIAFQNQFLKCDTQGLSRIYKSVKTLVVTNKSEKSTGIIKLIEAQKNLNDKYERIIL